MNSSEGNAAFRKGEVELQVIEVVEVGDDESKEEGPSEEGGLHPLSGSKLDKEPLSHSPDENGDVFQDLQIPSGRDTGYGWLVVFATFWINTIVAGYMKSFGLVYAPIKERYPETSTATAGLMMGLLNGCRGILSPMIGALSVMVGPRICSISGTLLMVTGLLLAIPGISALYLAFTVGALVGIGACMAETPGFIVVSEYFLEKRSTANGLRTSGNAFGGVVIPFFALYLLEYQPFQGYFILFAGFVLQMCIFGMFYRPFETHQRIVQAEFFEDLKKRSECTDDLEAYRKATKMRTSAKKDTKKKPLNFALLKNPAYMIYIIMMAICNIAIPNVLMYMPLFGRYKGLTELENSIILSFLSILDFFCRMFLGWLSDKKLYSKRHAFIFGLVAAGSSLLILPLAYNMWTIIAIMWLRSFGIAMFWALINGLLADQFGAENMATSWGFVRMTQGITNFIYPPLLGAIADATGSMNSPFVVMGGMQLLAAFIFALQPLVIRVSGIDVPLT